MAKGEARSKPTAGQAAAPTKGARSQPSRARSRRAINVIGLASALDGARLAGLQEAVLAAARQLSHRS